MTKRENKFWWVSMFGMMGLLFTSFGQTFYWLAVICIIMLCAFVRSEKGN